MIAEAGGMSGEAVFVGSYVAVLVAIALAMDGIARVSSQKIHRVKTIGFRFHRHLNAWQCSEGTFLWHKETDDIARVIRYAAKAEICNACRLKPVCTDSSDG